MQVYLVRHGQTKWNLRGHVQGMTDIPLNETGINQAYEIKEKLGHIQFDYCFSSPLGRAKETASIICEGNPILVDARLIERSFGLLEGSKVTREMSRRFWDYNLNATEDLLEGIQCLFARTKSFLDDLKKNYKEDDTILVVSHGSTIRALHFNIMGYTPSTKFLTVSIPNCGVGKYEI